MLDLFNNKVAFLKKKPKMGFIAVIFVFIVLLILLYYVCKVKVYDQFQTKGIVTCASTCTITVLIPSNLSYDEIWLNNKYIHFEEIEKELQVDEENLESYFKLTLATSEALTNNEIVNLTFYYNKQRIITKIKEKMF